MPSSRTLPNYAWFFVNLIAALKCEGVDEIVNSGEKIVKGLEAALIEAGEKGLFVVGISNLSADRFLQIGHDTGKLGGYEKAGRKMLKIGFKDKSEAENYLRNHVLTEERVIDYREIARKFILAT
jgi:hypothetical protein